MATDVGLIGRLHQRGVHNRRVRVLAKHLAALIPPGAGVLDVGCGDGLLASRLLEAVPDVSISGIDVLVREAAAIPVEPYDGQTIPHPDRSFDVVLLVDVLHHTDDPALLLAEARRVARRAIVIKDHCRNGFLAGPTLRFMDWVGNAAHGVRLPYNYWARSQWRKAFAELGLSIESWQSELGLYPFPAGLWFDRSLHFIARLTASPNG